ITFHFMARILLFVSGGIARRTGRRSRAPRWRASLRRPGAVREGAPSAAPTPRTAGGRAPRPPPPASQPDRPAGAVALPLRGKCPRGGAPRSPAPAGAAGHRPSAARPNARRTGAPPCGPRSAVPGRGGGRQPPPRRARRKSAASAAGGAGGQRRRHGTVAPDRPVVRAPADDRAGGRPLAEPRTPPGRRGRVADGPRAVFGSRAADRRG